MAKSKNEMTIDECKMLLPKKSWFGPARSKTGKAIVPESSLQSYANQAIFLRRWTYIRFAAKLMAWIKHNPAVPEWVKILFFTQVAGRLPDNFILVQVAPGCFLGVKLELKTQDIEGNAVGRTHGKQKRYAENEQWFIARSPEQINAVLDNIEIMAEKVRACLTSKI